jgi:DNA-binding CsgD family transcriptional regulator
MSDLLVRTPGDEQLLRESLADLARRTGFPIVFGGFAQQDRVVLTQLLGNKGDSLRGLDVRMGSGLGGRTLLERRPRLTADYGASRAITHDYDQAVLAEGITTLMAIPVVVGSTVAAVLYGGLRTRATLGSVSIDPSLGVAKGLAAQLEHLSESAPITSRTPAHQTVTAAVRTSQLEELRCLYADVRGMESTVADPHGRAQLAEIGRRIVAIASGVPAVPLIEGDQRDRLTAREADVLSLVALGYANAAVGRTLSVTEATVKSYMNSVMRKLGTTNRFEAVAAARRRQLLP